MITQYGEPTTSSKARGIDEDYGTWWEVSAHPYCSNKIIGTNKTLMKMIQENPDEVLGKGFTLHETLRLAYLDTKDALSIQVHPEDDYALEHSNDYGKYESWYILDAKPGSDSSCRQQQSMMQMKLKMP